MHRAMSTATIVPPRHCWMVASKDATSAAFTAGRVSWCWFTAKQSIHTRVVSGALRRCAFTALTSLAKRPFHACDTK